MYEMTICEGQQHPVEDCWLCRLAHASTSRADRVHGRTLEEACDDLPKFGSLQLKISGNAKAHSLGLLQRLCGFRV